MTQASEKKAGATERYKKVPMSKETPEVRAHNFEVAPGYDEANALKATKHCLQCPKPPCRVGCLVKIAIQRSSSISSTEV